MLTPTRSSQAVLVVASTPISPGLVEAANVAIPDATVLGAWAGDPLLRRPGGVSFVAPVGEVGGIPIAHLTLALKTVELEWAIGATVAAELLDRFETVTVLRSGSAIVAGPLDRLTSGPTHGVRLIARPRGELRFDGIRPDPIDLGQSGMFSSAAWSVDVVASAAMLSLASKLASDPARRLGSGLAEIHLDVPVDLIDDPAIGAGSWGWPESVVPALIDVDGWSPERPLELVNFGGEPRVSVARRPDIAATMIRHRDQLGNQRSRLMLPGGIIVDATIRRLVAEAIVTHVRHGTDLPPDPFLATAGFLRWLDAPSAAWSPHAGRYWRTRWEQRHDLIRAMPDPDGHDLAGLQAWSRRSWRDEGHSALLGPVAPRPTTRWASPQRVDGVNLVGYFSKASSLGHIARTLHAQLAAAGIATACIDVPFSPSPTVDEVPRTVEVAPFQHNLVIGSADSFGMIRSVVGPDVLVPDRTDVYWFWELASAPERHRRSGELVRKLIAPSAFVGEAYAHALGMTVEHVPFIVPEPVVGALPARYRDLPPASAVLLVTFDYHSISARKNPIGAIEAFRRAFAPGEGPLLLVKSTNALAHRRDHESVAVAAMGRDDIVLWDEVLPLDQQMAVVQAADVMVSLHRSEGLGLHLAEAMWLGTPTIATNWSGNLDFQSELDSMLVPARQIPVVDDLGIYDAAAEWADPDLDAAAASMRLLVDDRQRATHLSEAGRTRMRNQPSQPAAGTLLWNSITRRASGTARSRR